MSISSLVVLVAAMAVAYFCRKLSRAVWDCQVRLVRLEQGMVDLATDHRYRLINQKARLEQQEMVEKSVDTGAASAETIHKAVAGVTFGILDSIPATKGMAGLVRGVHDGIADTVYSTVRSANKEIGGVTKEYLKEKDPKDKPSDGSRRPLEDGDAE